MLVLTTLQPDEWPEDVASEVRHFKVSASGASVSMHDAVQACPEVLELLGAVRGDRNRAV